MRHYAARQRVSDGRWDYTVERNGQVRATGYCCAWEDPDVIEQSLTKLGIHFGQTDAEKANWRAYSHLFHTDGHATAEEAQNCYRQYILNHHLRYDADAPEEQLKCQECQAWTIKRVVIDGSTVLVLCPEHQTREIVEKFYKQIGESWCS